MATTKDSKKYDQVSVAQSFGTNVSAGELPDFSYARIYGRNIDLGTSIEDICKILNYRRKVISGSQEGRLR